MRAEDDEPIEGDTIFGHLRLVLGVAAALAVPVWMMATVTLATVSDAIRYLDNDDPDVHLMAIDLETGEEVRAERSQVQRVALAGLEVALVMGAIGLGAAPIVVGAILWSGRRRGHGGEAVLEDALVEGAELSVSIRRGADWPAPPPPSAATPAEPTFDDSHLHAPAAEPLHARPAPMPRRALAEPTFDESELEPPPTGADDAGPGGDDVDRLFD